MNRGDVEIRAAAGQPAAMAAMVGILFEDARTGQTGTPIATLLRYAESWGRRIAAQEPSERFYLAKVLAFCAGWSFGGGDEPAAVEWFAEVLAILDSAADEGNDAALAELVGLVDELPAHTLTAVLARVHAYTGDNA